MQQSVCNLNTDCLQLVQAAMKQAIYNLPQANRDLLEKILQFLWITSKNSTKNLMTSSNLSLIFGPCFFNIINTGTLDLGHNSTVKYMIEEYEVLFKDLFEVEDQPISSPVWKMKLIGPAH